MTFFVDALDGANGRLLATLPCSLFLWWDEPFSSGVARRLRAAFVAEGMLDWDQAEGANFEVREGKSRRHA